MVAEQVVQIIAVVITANWPRRPKGEAPISTLSDLLSRFEESAKQLNAASDSINTAITDVEQRLANANAGLEVRLEDTPLDSSESKLGATDEATDERIYEWTELLLGFAKLSQAEE
jgi:hypothetical protein